MHLHNIAWKAVGTATVDGTKRTRYWRAWTRHCQLYESVIGRQPLDQDTTDRLLTFAVAVREGKYGLENQVKVQSVERALRHITQKLVLDGHPDPRRASPAQHSLNLLIAWIIISFGMKIPWPSPNWPYQSPPSPLYRKNTGGLPT